MQAVLPLENLTGSEEQQLFVEGLHEEIISRLGRLQPQRLGVIARTSMLRYRETTRSIAEIGRELGADYVLEGSVRQDGRRVRVTAQLIQVSDQTHVWAETFERELGDLLSVQVGIGAGVADALVVDVLPEALAAVDRSAQLSVEAYAAFRRGMYFLERRALDHPANTRRAVEHFRRVVADAPAYAEGHAALAEAYRYLAVYAGSAERATLRNQALDAVSRALALDATLPAALLALGSLRFDDWDRTGALDALEQAVARDQNSAEARYRYANVLAFTGRHGEADTQIRAAQQLDPLNPMVRVGAFYVYLAARRLDQAEASARALAELAPDSSAHAPLASLVRALRSDCAGALARLPSLATLLAEPDASSHAHPVGYILGRCAPAAEMARWMSVAETRPDTYGYTMAATYAGAGKVDEALRWLEESFRRREGPAPFSALDPMFDSVRGDPRFLAIFERAGVTP